MNGVRHAMRLAAAASAVVALTAGCAGARNALGTSASPCFKALPAAQTAVRGKSHLVGVRRVQASTLQKRLPQDQRFKALPPGEHVCVFAFSGNFTGSDVVSAPPTSSGHYAVVALTGNRPVVVAAQVLDRLPTRFRHTRA